MSYSSRRQPPPPPPKKKRTGLIVFLVVAIIIAIITVVVIILILRKNANTPPAGKCFTDPDCPTGKVCNTASQLCVTCLTDANCSGTNGTCDTTSHTCVDCLANSDCSGTTPVCDVPNKTCVGCLTSASCSGATPVCNVAAKTCVGCLTSGDCASGQICSETTQTCSAPECTSNLDCTADPAKGACNAGVCRQCSVNSDCTGNPLYNDDGKVVCRTSDHTCQECVTAADCGGSPNTCTDDACCNLAPPTVAACTCNISANSTISGGYTTTQPPTGAQHVIRLSTPSGNVLFTSPPSTANGVISLSQTGMAVIIFPNVNYKVAVRLVYPCGSTPFSPDFTFTPAIQATSTDYNTMQTIPVVNSDSGSATNGINFQTNNPPGSAPSPSVTVVMSKTAGFHPNDATKIITGVFSTQTFPCLYSCPPGVYTAPFGTTFVNYAETWYYRFAYETSFSTSNPVPGDTYIGYAGNLSTERSVVLGP